MQVCCKYSQKAHRIFQAKWIGILYWAHTKLLLDVSSNSRWFSSMFWQSFFFSGVRISDFAMANMLPPVRFCTAEHGHISSPHCVFGRILPKTTAEPRRTPPSYERKPYSYTSLLRLFDFWKTATHFNLSSMSGWSWDLVFFKCFTLRQEPTVI